MAFSPDGTRLVTDNGSSHARLYDIASEQELVTLSTPSLFGNAGVFFLDADTIFGADWINTARRNAAAVWTAAPLPSTGLGN